MWKLLASRLATHLEQLVVEISQEWRTHCVATSPEELHEAGWVLVWIEPTDLVEYLATLKDKGGVYVIREKHFEELPHLATIVSLEVLFGVQERVAQPLVIEREMDGRLEQRYLIDARALDGVWLTAPLDGIGVERMTALVRKHVPAFFWKKMAAGLDALGATAAAQDIRKMQAIDG